MKFNLTAKVFFTTLAFCGAVGAPAIAQMYPGAYPYPAPAPNTYPYPAPAPANYPAPTYKPPAPKITTFICGRVGNWPATLVQVNGQTRQSPLLVFQTASNNLSPQQRCDNVSQRLTSAVAQNGGKMSNLLLTTGKLNNQAVICVVNAAETCNPSNVILTLVRQENARNPGRVLARIVRYGKFGGGLGTVESGGGIEGEEEIVPQAVSLEEVVNEVANEAGSPESGGTVPSYDQTPGDAPDTGTGGGPI